MDPHSMGIQGGISMGMTGTTPQVMNVSMYGQAPPPPQMMMNSMTQQQQMPIATSQINLANISSTPAADWRIQLTREHRANLIAKIYNEMVRVAADPVPGIKLWMNVSWYELTLYKESPTQEIYINKIFTRLKSLRAQQSDMNAAIAAQGLPNQGMLFRLDFSYYNTLNLSQRDANGNHVRSYPGHNQLLKPETSTTVNSVAEYWQQHAALRAKHQGDVEKVHSAFKKYVDHMKGHDETEQKKKLRYLLSYVELCASILSEEKATHKARKIEELDKVFKYIVKIVNPYLKKLRTETDKRSYPGIQVALAAAMTQLQQPAGQTQHQSAPTQHSAMTVQQKQQHYMMQQRAQQMQQQQQQQHMQMQARQQQMIKQQQLMRQHQMQLKSSQQQAQFSAQQSSQMKQQPNNNSQNAAATDQQSDQQTQQQLGQQGPSRPQQGVQNSVQQQQKPPQPRSKTSTPHRLEDRARGLMDFSNALSPTSFGGMDLLDWDDGTTSGPGPSGQNNTTGDPSDLMTFVETL
ncbi:unnamed protein product [Peronospora destructor]|uniref:Mediator complex subunit 15 KIX domain-containing protein n=2 Tax=Peronospora destructor TaxID=86335 RepID=A0AAV0U2Y2_9STRA|nr:unnamed protein product [Peronospora destructor]